MTEAQKVCTQVRNFHEIKTREVRQHLLSVAGITAYVIDSQIIDWLPQPYKSETYHKVCILRDTGLSLHQLSLIMVGSGR